MTGSYSSVWKIESERIGLVYGNDVSLFKRFAMNRLVLFNVGHVLYLAAVWKIFGTDALVFHLMYSFI